MKRRNFLPGAALVMGLACLAGRRVLYAANVDATGLLKAGTFLEWGTYLLSAVALGLWAAASRRERGKLLPDSVTALGQFLGAAGMGLTALYYPGQMPGLLGTLWKLFGILSAFCLILCGICVKTGKNPGFLAPLAPCLFWLIHLVDNYRGWSAAPQLQSYLFPLLATMAMTLFTYYSAAEAVDMGKPRRKQFAALTAGYFCMAAALPGKGQLMYLLSALWALSSL